MSFQMEDRVVFPEGPDTLVDFTKLRLFIEKGREVQVLYKLYYHPVDNDSRRWEIDQDWKPLRGKANGDKVEFIFDPEKDHRACGIQFKFVQASSNQSFLLEKYILFYSNPSLI
jgi:hypothetical protein